MRVLQVAYHYPPQGGAAVQRALKFTRYLPGFGVTPIVLAAHDPHYVADETLAAEIPVGVRVIRIAHTPLAARLLSLARKLYRPAKQADAATAAAATAAGTPHRLRDRLLRLYALLQFPDDKAGWAWRAASQARRLARAGDIDLIFTSSPPASAHWVGWWLKRREGVPWVADFRDLWTDNPDYNAPAWRRALDRRLESRVLRDADGVTTVTETWRESLNTQRRVGLAPVRCIPNGYDESDFAGLDESHSCDAEPLQRLRIVHSGTLYGSRTPAGFFAGLDAFLRAHPEAAARVRVRWVGNIGTRFEPQFEAFDRRHPGILEQTGYLTHRSALAELIAADALLLIIGGEGDAARGWLPGKLFEYLRSRRPVLLLGDPKGEAAGLLRRHGHGFCVAEDDTAGIARALAAMCEARWPAPPADAASIERFERQRLAGELAAYLGECIRAETTGEHAGPPQVLIPPPAGAGRRLWGAPVTALNNESDRLQQRYAERDGSPALTGFWTLQNPVVLHLMQERERVVLRALKREGVALASLRLLDLGCGLGTELPNLLRWGASHEQVIGVDPLLPRLAQARSRYGMRVAQIDGTRLPFADASFDIVNVSVVFSSIVDAKVRRALAAEAERVLAPAGWLMWYDLSRRRGRYDPFQRGGDPHVKPLPLREVQALFPAIDLRFEALSSDLGVLRRAERWLGGAGMRCVDALPGMRTHLFALGRKTERRP